MANFGANAIAPVTGGLRFSTGTFPVRLVSRGYIGQIAASLTITAGLVANIWRFTKKSN